MVPDCKIIGLTSYSLFPSMFLQMTGFHSSLWLNKAPLWCEGISKEAGSDDLDTYLEVSIPIIAVLFRAMSCHARSCAPRLWFPALFSRYLELYLELS